MPIVTSNILDKSAVILGSGNVNFDEVKQFVESNEVPWDVTEKSDGVGHWVAQVFKEAVVKSFSEFDDAMIAYNNAVDGRILDSGIGLDDVYEVDTFNEQGFSDFIAKMVSVCDLPAKVLVMAFINYPFDTVTNPHSIIYKDEAVLVGSYNGKNYWVNPTTFEWEEFTDVAEITDGILSKVKSATGIGDEPTAKNIGKLKKFKAKDGKGYYFSSDYAEGQTTKAAEAALKLWESKGYTIPNNLFKKVFASVVGDGAKKHSDAAGFKIYIDESKFKKAALSFIKNVVKVDWLDAESDLD